MITNNFKNILCCVLQSLGGSTYGMLPVKGCNGTVYYFGCCFSTGYPYSVSTGLTTSVTGSGIMFGTGTTAPTEEDYKAETPITSGISATSTYERNLDENGNPYLEFNLVVTNSGASTITITEVSFQQNCRVTTAQKSTSYTSATVCLDHTLLDEPVSIPAGGQRIIKYSLKTVIPS